MRLKRRKRFTVFGVGLAILGLSFVTFAMFGAASVFVTIGSHDSYDRGFDLFRYGMVTFICGASVFLLIAMLDTWLDDRFLDMDEERR